MNKHVAIIVGGTGQFGRILTKKLLKKNYFIIITTRSVNKSIKFFKKDKNLKIVHLDIFNKIKIEKLLKIYNPKFIFYFAGQSLPKLSFNKKKETYQSNVIGCKNFLETIKKNKDSCKFINTSSCEIYGNTRKKITLLTKKKPVNPYGIAKLKSLEITKEFRYKYKLNTYNAIIFNTESFLRNKKFLIPKICLAAIKAKKFGAQTEFGNLNISREWNWCEEQCDVLLKFIKKNPQDFILSNGKNFSAKEMLKFAFNFFNLNYQKYIRTNKKFVRKKDIVSIHSDYKTCLKRNSIKRKINIFGKKMINKLINHYLNEQKY